MASADVDIANAALLKLGSPAIVALTDGTKAARTIAARYDDLRRDELSNNPWTFAMLRTTLPALSAFPAYGFGLAYQIPTDCLQLVQVNDFDYPSNASDYRSILDVPFALEGGRILTDWPAPLKLRYVQDITDVTRFSPSFCEVLACRIAYECCETILQSATKKDGLMKEHQMAIARAGQNNAIEKPPESAPDDSWVMGRL
jgi:hypothetical protein